MLLLAIDNSSVADIDVTTGRKPAAHPAPETATPGRKPDNTNNTIIIVIRIITTHNNNHHQNQQ